MTAQELQKIQEQLNTGIKDLEKEPAALDMVYQQLVDAQQALNKALRGLRNREREKESAGD